MSFKQVIKKLIPNKTKLFIKSLILKSLNKKMLDKSEMVIPFDNSKYPFGINLIGDIKAETGLGQSMRNLANVLEKCNIPFCIYQIDSPGELDQNDATWNDKIEKNVKYGINLIHINSNMWAENYLKLDSDIWNSRYNIAYWLWELEEFPDEWVPGIETVDEVWAPSEFICNSIRKKTSKKVIRVPYVIDINSENLMDRNYFNIPQDKFLFLLMYDFHSISERKNPSATIEAFIDAFSENENIGIIIKVNHLKNVNELEKLKSRLKGYENVYYITRNMSRREIESLIYVADVLVSLHRSEGFGLPMAEAMYLGTPVIATNWSANVEFMNEESACLVNYKLVNIIRNVGPYKKGNRWAEADIYQAAEYMKQLYSNRIFYQQKVDNGQKYVSEKLSYKNIIGLIEARVKEILGEI